MRLLLLILTLFVFGCSTMQYTPNSYGGGVDGIDVLYEYPPQGKFKSLGIIDFDFYQPGWRTPSTTDALPELKQKIHENGGNALIIRDQRQSEFNTRRIHISAECLYIEK